MKDGASVWVVEWKIDGIWRPVAGASLTEDECQWRIMNMIHPDDFRASKYQRVDD